MTAQNIPPLKDCLLCQQPSCDEDSLHVRVTPDYFTQLIQSQKRSTPQIEYLKGLTQKALLKQSRIYGVDMGVEQTRIFQLLAVLELWRFVPALGDLSALIHLLQGEIGKAGIEKCYKVIRVLETEECPAELECDNLTMFYRVVQEVDANLSFSLYEMPQDFLYRGFYKSLRKLEAKVFEDFTTFAKDLAAPATSSEKNYSILPRISQRHQQEEDDFVYIFGVPIYTGREEVNLSMIQMSDQDILESAPQLQKVHKLRALEIRNNKLTEFGYRVLANCLSNLKSLDLRECTGLTPKALQEILRKMGKMEQLYITKNNIDDETAQTIADHLPNLIVLFLDENNLTLKGVTELINRLPRLRFLSVKKNGLPEDEAWRIKCKFGCRGHLDI